MIRCNTSISLITVTVGGWPAGCTGDAGDTGGGCTGGTGAAATSTIGEASRLTKADIDRCQKFYEYTPY